MDKPITSLPKVRRTLMGTSSRRFNVYDEVVTSVAWESMWEMVLFCTMFSYAFRSIITPMKKSQEKYLRHSREANFLVF